MQDDSREAGTRAPVFLAWGTPAEARESALGGATLWLTGGASLLLWTAISLLLTSA